MKERNTNDYIDYGTLIVAQKCTRTSENKKTKGINS
jgi:hypothetical protein